MVDWEFWGSKKAWIAMGIGGLMLIVAIPLILNEKTLGAGVALAIIGAIDFCVVGYYLVYWENWLLLQKKKGV
jgi:hypothetical protein